MTDVREPRPTVTTAEQAQHAADWVARNAHRWTWDGLRLPGVARTVYRCVPALQPAHLLPWELMVLGRGLALTGHVLLRDGRIVHRDLVRPPRLAHGHAYRTRTRRRTRRNRRG